MDRETENNVALLLSIDQSPGNPEREIKTTKAGKILDEEDYYVTACTECRHEHAVPKTIPTGLVAQAPCKACGAVGTLATGEFK